MKKTWIIKVFKKKDPNAENFIQYDSEEKAQKFAFILRRFGVKAAAVEEMH